MSCVIIMVYMCVAWGHTLHARGTCMYVNMYALATFAIDVCISCHMCNRAEKEKGKRLKSKVTSRRTYYLHH